MAQRNIDFGSFPDDPDADAIRAAFQKTQENFTELFNTVSNSGVSSINASKQPGITVNRSTGNVLLSNDFYQLKVKTNSLGLRTFGLTPVDAVTINSGLSNLYVDLLDNTIINTSLLIGSISPGDPNVYITNGNIVASDTLTANIVNADSANINETLAANNIAAVANISATYFLGNGYYLTGISGSGTQGATGATGPAGTNGATGLAGATGVTGATGPAGATGSGATGATGTSGVQGATGPTGAQGFPGATGATGTTGPAGIVEGPTAPPPGDYLWLDTVSPGLSGPTGATGVTGPTGATGVGATGATGAQGATGPVGASGAPGGAYVHTQSLASTTWTVTHNLNSQYVNIEPVAANGYSYVGRYDYPTVYFDNANVVTLTFNSAVTGYAAVSSGGAVGATGPAGATGPSGGPTGATGLQGATGLTGATGSAGVAAGSNTQVQFNDATAFGADANLTFNKTTGSLSVGGNYLRSVQTGISAAGSTQGTATALTKDISVVSTVSASQGVVLPTAVTGMVLIVNNTSATSLNVYPASGAAINSLATNAAYTHVAGASLQYYAVSSTQWYTVGATYA